MNAKDIDYKLILTRETGERLNITAIVIGLTWEEQPEELAMRLSFELANTKHKNEYMSSILKLLTVITLYASQGNGYEEVFNGIVWDWTYTSSNEKTISIVAYDRLIYLQNSKDNKYFSAGTSTADVIRTICTDWGIPYKYEYDSIKHSKLLYQRTNVSDMIIKTLKEAQDKLDSKYVLNFKDGMLNIKKQGQNSIVYFFAQNQNSLSTKNRLTLDDLVTEVWITGKADNEGRLPIEAKEIGDISYGTLREMISRDGDNSLADAQAEAKKILKECGKPKEYSNIKTVDVPTVRRGDKIKVEAGNLIGYFYVLGISHDAESRTMDMEIERVS